ncbi:helix-turn-helix transcriptional regulator [Sphingomonas sp. MMS24-J45]|uniref:helix-turn-helix transcriptional regulator n=1 Tax=Sphingomonas sp. MMS24-J45 TaxID=3238806 RepID=UPI00384E6756
MSRLKELRLASGRTQSDVAAELGTSQQTYARWENGKSEPSHAVLVKIAHLFGASIDHILGRSLPAIDQRNRIPSKRKAAKYWGDLGLRPRGGSLTFGFPVTAEQADRVRQRVASVEKLPDWITVETMNNRVLAFRPKQMRRIWLVDEADEFPEEFHFNNPCDGPAGMPLEVYRAMVDWADQAQGDGDAFSCHPKALQKSALVAIKRAGFIDTPGALGGLLRNTVIHHVGGEMEAYEVDHDDLTMAMFHLENSKHVDVIELSGTEERFERFHPLDDVAMIEFSAVELEAAWNEERGEYEA